jgi:hypothetical protein
LISFQEPLNWSLFMLAIRGWMGSRLYWTAGSEAFIERSAGQEVAPPEKENCKGYWCKF